MTEIFTPVYRLLSACWAAISMIDWSQYGDKLMPYDDMNVPKWTGVLLHHNGKPLVGGYTRSLGFLPRAEKSAITVAKKLLLLAEHPNVSCSMELRNPERGDWGGGIRLSTNPDQAFGLTGLPEIGDHLLMARLMRECDLLTQVSWHDLTSPDPHCIVAARVLAGMSPEQFRALNKRIFDIVQDGLRVMQAASS